MKIHYELLKYVYGQSYTSWNLQLHWSRLPLIYGVWHPYKHMITMLYHNVMPIMCLIERVHTDFKEGDAVPTKVKLLHIEKTILALFLNASTYLPRVRAKLDAFAVTAQNGPLTDMYSKSKELLLGLKVLLKEYCPAAFRIGVLVRDCTWVGPDPGSGKNALAVLESCLLVMLSLLGDQWENVEYTKTLVAAPVTWQRWHSRTPSCIHSEEYGEAMFSRLCAQCRIWTTITSLSGTSEIFVTLSETVAEWKNLRFSLTEKCLKRYGSNLGNLILSVFVASLPIVQWKPPPLRVVEAVVLRSVDDLRFPRTFAAVPPHSLLFSVFHKYIRTLLRKNPPSNDVLTVVQQTVPPSTIARQRNVDIQRVMQITSPPKPKPKPKPETGKPIAKPAAPHPRPPAPPRHGAPIAQPAPRNPKPQAKLGPQQLPQNRVQHANGGGGGGMCGQCER